jgi:IS5 family transposase
MLHRPRSDGEPLRTDRGCPAHPRLRTRRTAGGARHDRGLRRSPAAITLGADKGYDAADFVEVLRTPNVRPHVARNTNRRRSAIDRRATRHSGYGASQRIRKRIEEAFGWMKTVAGMRKTKLRDLPKVGWAFTFAAAAYNLVRLPKLMAEPA